MTQILLIEDEPRIVAFVQAALENEAMTVLAAYDGHAGLQLALDEDIDLAILDLGLPRLNGLQLLECLRAAKPDLPVLILSARSQVAARLEGFRLGANDYLVKPFSVDELIARVRVHLRHGAQPGDPVIRAGDLELDLIRQQARLPGGAVELSRREFAVMRCLAQSAGDVVTRQQLLAEVWGYDFDPGTNVVDVCVRRLRVKLGPVSPIVTVRQLGYSLAVSA